MIQKESRSAVRTRRHLRVRAKISGTAECPRLVVFRSNKHIEAQLIDDTKGMTLACTSSVQLKLANGSNCEAAAKVGEADKVYVRVDQNKAYWVRGEETGDVDLW